MGSGFGGSVVACRLAEGGLSVCVLERGQAWPPGDFPRTPRDIHTKGFWDPGAGRYGIYNVWSFPGFGALVSSGLGGGSLIYANVLLRKDENTFVQDGRESWPLTREDLEPHYDRVEPVLSGGPYPIDHEPYARTAKTHAMRTAAAGLKGRGGREDTSFLLPNLAVAFGNENESPRPGVELEGVPPSVHEKPHPRLSCMLTGECDLGCNYGSKNTLDLTFLGLAKHAATPATVKPCCEVTSIAPLEDGYRVTFVDHTERVPTGEPAGDPPARDLTTRRLVLAAGTFGSTFLLLRCRDAFPEIDPRVLGTGFSANGDLLSFLVRARTAENGPRVLEASYGPVITSAIHVPAEGRRGHYVQDAGYPYLVSWLAELAALPSITRRAVREGVERTLSKLVGRDVDTDLGAELAEIVGEGLLSSSSMPLLSMGRDVRGGRFSLDGKRLSCDWDPDDSSDYFEELEETLRGIADTLGGAFRDSRIRGLTKQITVHPLGGCPMGASEREGVVDPFGEVHGHPGFFIADGSVLPGPVGPNPSLTIAALADRFAGRMLA